MQPLSVDALCHTCGEGAQPYRSIRDYLYYRCSYCGLQFLEREPEGFSTQAVYDDDYFFGGGAGYPDYLQEGPLLIDRGKAYARIVGRYVRPGRVLDIGSAAGFILRGFIDSGWSGSGLEPNRTMVAYAQEELGVEVAAGAIEDARFPASVDLVTMIQVLEHVRDLGTTLDKAAGATKPGGLWFCETMDGGSLMARVLGIQWHGYSPPSVLRIFTLDALDRAAAEWGLERIGAGRPLKWISGAHAKSLLGYKAGDGILSRMAHAGAQVIPDDCALPYPGRDILWTVYRKGT